MADLSDLQAELDDWVKALAAKTDDKELARLNRALATELRRANQSRIKSQTDPAGKRFIKPLQAKNNPMFKKLATAKHLKKQATKALAATGFSGNAAKIAIIHHEGRMSTVRPDSSKKFAYPERPLLGVATKDRHMIMQKIREHLAQ